MHLSGLFLYPVKALRGRAVSSAMVEPCGLAGDRRWMLVDAQGRFLTQRRLPMLARFTASPSEGGLTLGLDTARLAVATPAAGGERMEVTIWQSRLHAACAGEAADAWFSARLGQDCRLVFLDDTQARPIDPEDAQAPGTAQVAEHVSFADGFPALAASETSLACLNAALTDPVGMDRFRCNLMIAGAPPWDEDDWALLRIGAVRFRAPKTCTRCVVTTIDQATGEVPHRGEPLATLARLNRKPEGIVFGRNLVPLDPGSLHVGDRIEILQRSPRGNA